MHARESNAVRPRIPAGGVCFGPARPVLVAHHPQRASWAGSNLPPLQLFRCPGPRVLLPCRQRKSRKGCGGERAFPGPAARRGARREGARPSSSADAGIALRKVAPGAEVNGVYRRERFQPFRGPFCASVLARSAASPARRAGCPHRGVRFVRSPPRTVGAKSDRVGRLEVRAFPTPVRDHGFAVPGVVFGTSAWTSSAYRGYPPDNRGAVRLRPPRMIRSRLQRPASPGRRAGSAKLLPRKVIPHPGALPLGHGPPAAAFAAEPSPS